MCCVWLIVRTSISSSLLDLRHRGTPRGYTIGHVIQQAYSNTHCYYSRGNEASTVEGKNGSWTAFSWPSGNRMADEAFYHKIRGGRHCEGECTEGGISTASVSNLLGHVEKPGMPIAPE